jgi:WD40 repeat protein
MATTLQIKKVEKAFYADDGAKRGPLTMARVRFHPREAQLLAQTADRRLALFNLAAAADKKGKGGTQHVPCSWVCPHEIGWVRGLAIHPHGTAIATGGSDRSLRIWTWQDGQPGEKPAQQVASHEGWVESVAYSPDGGKLATCGSDGLVKIWQAGDLKLLHTFEGHKHAVFDVLFTKSGDRVVSGGEDGLCKVWDVARGELVRELSFGYANDQFGQNPRHSGVHRLSLSHDERWLAVAGGEQVDVFDFAEGKPLASEKPGMEAAFHPQRALLGVGESELKLWQYDEAALAKASEAKPDKNNKPKEIPGKLVTTIKRGDYSLGVDFSADGRQLALGKADGNVELYELS